MRIDIVHPLAVIDLRAYIFRNKMPLFVNIVFILAHCETDFLVHPQHIRESKKSPLLFISRRFTYADKSMPFMHPTAHSRQDTIVIPIFPARIRGIRLAYIDNDVNIRIDPFLTDIVKGNKLYFDGKPRKSFQHSLIGVYLLIPQFMRYHMRLPAAQAAPAIQHRNGQAAIRLPFRRDLVNRAEFVTDLRNTADERRKLGSQ